MTEYEMRHFYASAALNGFLSGGDGSDENLDFEAIVANSFSIANLMVKEAKSRGYGPREENA